MLEHHRTRTFQEEYLALRNTAPISTRNTSGSSCARSDRTLRDGSFEGRFSQALHARLRSGCPYGTRWQTFRKQHLAKACCEMSRRDGAIVAWHEVLGTAPPQKSRPVGCGVIRAGVPTDSMIGLTIFRGRRSSDTNRSKRVFSLKKHGAHFDEKYLWE